MKQLAYLLITVILVASCGDTLRALAIEPPQNVVAAELFPAAPNLGDLLVHVVSPISKTPILPSTYPLPGAKSLSLYVTACRGEFESASFVLQAQNHDLSGVTLTATALHGVNSSAVISSTHVDIKIVKPWFQSYYAWNEIGKSEPADFRQRLYPELLLKDDALVKVDRSTEQNLIRLERGGQSVYEWINQKKLAASEQVLPTMQEFPVKDAMTLQPFALPQSTNKQVWVTVFVPHNSPADEYSGDIQVRENGELKGTIKINLKVHMFNLAESEITHTIYYRAVLDDARASVGSEYRNTEQMRAELQNLLNHGVQNPTMYQPLSSLERLRGALQLRKDLGMNNGPLYYLGVQTTGTFLGNTSPQAENLLGTIYSQINEIALAHGFTSVYIYGRDEVRGAELEAQRGLWNILHGLGGKVFVAGYTDSFELVGDSLDLLVHAHQPSIQEATKWHSSGHKIFNYANPQSGPENPFLFRLNYGIVLWANGYDGAMPYAYQHCFGSCWNDMDAPTYRDHNLTYPTADGVIDTLAWEGFREAVDDVRYLTTLEKLLSNLSTNNATPAANEARSFLNTLKTTVLSKQTQSGKYNLQMDIDLDAVRNQVVTHLDAITNGR
ncbi:MAG TPA: hypothetical protein PKK23_08950 [Nitrospirales bacterium]|nr:hypothetical protein [Nitrospiraceae bacterium]HNP29157.1 hypothetical protein [Nitrospirales bacterium]